MFWERVNFLLYYFYQKISVGVFLTPQWLKRFWKGTWKSRLKWQLVRVSLCSVVQFVTWSFVKMFRHHLHLIFDLFTYSFLTPLPDNKILDRSKLKQIADNILALYLMCQFWALSILQQVKIWCQKYGQMEIQLSDWVENIVGKEEIALYEQFLLFLECFLKLFVVDASNWVSME